MRSTLTEPSVATARDFVRSLVLPEPPQAPRRAGAVGSAFDSAKDQAAVVGSEVISFVSGVTPEQRHDVVNASLLAQLVANQKVPGPRSLPDVVRWYEAYFDVLTHVGFVIQDRGFSAYQESSRDFEAHNAILEVAAVLLAGAPGALAVLRATLAALEKMATDSPWITLYERESRSANTARFQASLVERDEHALMLVSLIAFGMEAESKLTRVLFFKFRRSEVRLQHHSGRVTINAEVLAGVREAIAQRLVPFSADYVANLPDLAAVAPSPGGGPAAA